MERSRARRLGVKAGVCVLSLLNASQATEASPPARARLDLPATESSPGAVIYRARSPGAHPLTVVLHGMCGDAARACSFFAEQVTASANLICPRASARCTGGGATWPEQGVAEAVESAVARAKIALGESVDDSHGRTLIGYSMGAFRALGMAQSAGGKYPRVMLIGAKIALDSQRLEQNGVQRLLLCAGSWDMMHDHMQRETARVRRAGLSARFLDLGPVGHGLTSSFSEYLPQALSWLSGS
jgi:predicted esterase